MTEEAYDMLNPFQQSEYRMYSEKRLEQQGIPLPEYLEEDV